MSKEKKLFYFIFFKKKNPASIVTLHSFHEYPEWENHCLIFELNGCKPIQHTATNMKPRCLYCASI